MIREIPEGKYCVYSHSRLDKNEVFYIGISSNMRRPYENNKYARNNMWNKIVAKTSYVVDILFKGVSKEFAMSKEMELIMLHGRKDLKTGTLCNLTDGGEGTTNVTPEAIARRSKAMTGLKRSEETKKKLSESKKGWKHTPEVTAIIQSKIKGLKRTDETRKRMSEAFKGHIVKESTREKLRQANLGKKKTKETIEKLIGRPGWNGRLLLHTTTGIYYESIREYAKATNQKEDTVRMRFRRGNKQDVILA